MTLPAYELEVIGRIAREVGIDAVLLAGIRVTENGGPGREFGVLSEAAPTFEAQARSAALSLRNSMQRFAMAHREEWIKFFAARWAPIGTGNDPHHLNEHWITNFTAATGP